MGTRRTFGERPLTEDDDCLPMNLYGTAKRLNDMTAQRYADLYGLDVVGLRIATVFGYGRETETAPGWARSRRIPRSGSGALPAAVLATVGHDLRGRRRRHARAAVSRASARAPHRT